MASCSTCSSSSTCSSAGHGTCPNELLAQQDRDIADRLSHIKHKLFVMSGKGGVGKSSVAVNIACALAQLGYRVGILDVDIHGPSVPNLLGLRDAVIEVDEDNHLVPARFSNKAELEVISMDTFLQDRDQAIIWRGPKKSSAIRQFIGDVAWGTLDFLVIDSPPGTGDEHMTILQTIPDAESVVVTTPQEVSLADVRKALNFLEIAKGKVLGIVENMSGLVCPYCHQEIDLFKKGGGRKLAEDHGVAFLGAVPIDPATVVSGDTGVPVVCMDQESPARDAFVAIAKKIVEVEAM